MIKKGFLYYLLATLMMAALMTAYMADSTAIQVMDVTGWLFFALSCVTHAAVLMLPFWLVFLPLAWLRLNKLAATLMVSATSILGMLLLVNMQVYRIYKFHINGMVLSLLTSEGAGDIFQFDTKLLLQESVLLLLTIATCTALWWVAARFCQHLSKRGIAASISIDGQRHTHLRCIRAKDVRAAECQTDTLLFPSDRHPLHDELRCKPGSAHR